MDNDRPFVDKDSDKGGNGYWVIFVIVILCWLAIVLYPGDGIMP